MNIPRRFTTVGAALIASLALGAQPAFAVAPGNDTITGAKVVTLGTSDTLDTREATTDAVDAQANETCGAPATDASVWYTLDVGTDTGVVIDVSTSDFSAGVLVATGTPGALTTVACGPGTVGFSAIAGTSYHVLAFDDQQDGAGNGGTLNISINAAPPPPTVAVTVAPRGTFDTKTGAATVHGTYTCTDAGFIDLEGEVTQTVGRIATIRGSFSVFDQQTCDGTPQQWTANATPQNGKFAGGSALTVAFSFACGPFECAQGFTEQTVRLTGGHK